VLNLINLLKKHGFVPNGSRLYYLNRRCWALHLFRHCCIVAQVHREILTPFTMVSSAAKFAIDCTFKLPLPCVYGASIDALLLCDLPLCLACSQPPLLSHMIAAIYDAEGGTAWLQAALPALEIEHIYWTSASKQLHVRAAWQEQGEVSHLSRYYADTETPRPEGYRSVQHLNGPKM